MYPAFEKYERRENLKFVIEAVLVGILVVASAVLIYAAIAFVTPDPIEVYEQSYAECLARETMTPEHCHDFALQQSKRYGL